VQQVRPVAAVAQEARVWPETIYLSLGGKRGLLEGVVEMTIAGADDRAGGEEAWWAEVAHLPDARERLGRAQLPDPGPYPPHPHGHSRSGRQRGFASALATRLLQERLTAQTERVCRHLAGHPRPGLSVDEGGLRYCALASPEVYHALAVEFGWTADQDRRWLADLLETDLLGAPRSERAQTERPAWAASLPRCRRA
jgi:hypothetical protein